MSYTLEELCERLKERVDPDLLLEELGLSTEDLVDRFEDRIAQRFNKMLQLVDD